MSACYRTSRCQTFYYPKCNKLSLSFEGIHCDVFDRVTPEPTDTLCLKIAYEIIANEYDCVLGIGGGRPMVAAKAATLIAGIPENISADIAVIDPEFTVGMPPIHTGNYKEKIGKICEAIYAEK